MLTPLFTAVAVLAFGAERPDVSKTLQPTPDQRSADPAATAADLYRLAEASTDPRARAESEYRLAEVLERGDMPAAALIEHMTIVRSGPAHLYYAKSLEALIALQRKLGDEYL